ncbi:hypothetical protein FQR65_LT09634 [Abscondita terminalis]|nr:hypothetical protein FQR65_LT09634 [Abscondita terminalis]
MPLFYNNRSLTTSFRVIKYRPRSHPHYVRICRSTSTCVVRPCSNNSGQIEHNPNQDFKGHQREGKGAQNDAISSREQDAYIKPWRQQTSSIT